MNQTNSNTPLDETLGRNPTERPPAAKEVVVSTEELSTNFFWSLDDDGGLRPPQTTLRGNPSAEEIIAHLQAVAVIFGKIRNNGGFVGGDKISNRQDTRAANTEGEPAAPPLTINASVTLPFDPTAPAAPVPATPAGTSEGEGRTAGVYKGVDRMEVQLRPDGFLNLLFMIPGHRRADIWMNKQSAEQAIKRLAKVGAWTAAHFEKPHIYDGLAWDVEWTQSDKVNSNGKPYRDIISITPHVA